MSKLVLNRNLSYYQISQAFSMLPPVTISFLALSSLVGTQVSFLSTLEMCIMVALDGKTFRNQGLAKIVLKPAIASL